MRSAEDTVTSFMTERLASRRVARMHSEEHLSASTTACISSRTKNEVRSIVERWKGFVL